MSPLFSFFFLSRRWRFIDEYAQGDRQLKFTNERDLIHFKIRVATPVEGKYVQYDGGKPDKDKKFTKQALALAEKVVGQKTVRMPSLKDRRYLSSTDQECIWYSMPKAVECPPESPIVRPSLSSFPCCSWFGADNAFFHLFWFCLRLQGTVVDGNPCQWKIVAEVGRWDFMRVLTNMMPSKWKKVMSPLMRTSPLPAGYWRKVPMGLADRLKGSKSMVEYFESAVEETERKQTLWGTRL